MINSNIIKRFKRDILEFNKGRGMGERKDYRLKTGDERGKGGEIRIERFRERARKMIFKYKGGAP